MGKILDLQASIFTKFKIYMTQDLEAFCQDPSLGRPAAVAHAPYCPDYLPLYVCGLSHHDADDDFDEGEVDG